MSVTTTYAYSSGGGFTYDSGVIEFVASKAQLKKINDPGKLFTQDFASATGFTYDSAKAEFVGGVVRQKDTRPSGATLFAAFTSSLDAAWGNGALTGTSIGGGAAVGGVLVGDSVVAKAAKWAAAGNVASASVGTIRFTTIPQYSGTPGAARIFFNLRNSTASLASHLVISHDLGGLLRCDIYNSGGALGASVSGAWSPVAGTPYEIELNYDVAAGSPATRLFLNGVQVGATSTATVTRLLSDINDIVLGCNFNESALYGGNSNYDNLVLFSTVQHTANYTPGTAPSESVYAASLVTLPAFAYPGPVGNIVSWTSLALTDANAPGYILNGLYWNGSAWVASNNTYAQSASAAATIANIATLPLADTVVVKAAFQDSAAVQMSVDNLLLTYAGQIYPVTNPIVTPNAGVTMDSLASFAATASAAGSDGVQWYLLVAGTPKWWNGAAWATSDGTYAQSNPAATINTNAAALTALITLGATVYPVAVLHSADGSTTPNLTSAALVYNYFAPTPTSPNVCELWGYLHDPQGIPIAGATVSVQNAKFAKNQGFMVGPKTVSDASDANGYFSMNLEETETQGLKFVFSITESGGTAQKLGSSIVPNAANYNIANLTFS